MNNKLTLIAGTLSARGIIILLALYIVLLLSPLSNPPEPGWKPAITSYYNIETSMGFSDYAASVIYCLTTLLLLILFICFHNLSSASYKTLSLMAVSLLITSFSLQIIACSGSVYIGNLAVAGDYNDKYVLYQSYLFLSNLISALYIVGSTALTGLAELALIPLFSGNNRTEGKMRLTLIITVSLHFSGFIAFIAGKEEISAISILAGFPVLIAFLIFSLQYLRNLKTCAYEK